MRSEAKLAVERALAGGVSGGVAGGVSGGVSGGMSGGVPGGAPGAGAEGLGEDCFEKWRPPRTGEKREVRSKFRTLKCTGTPRRVT